MMQRGHEIRCLDHGYVRLVDWMGSDEVVVEAARMSTGRGFVSWEPYRRCKSCDEVAVAPDLPHLKCGNVYGREHEWQEFPRGDLGILEFMWKNKHATPFEFGELHVEVQAPIMVFREWHRHRTQAYSEFSARYSQMSNFHYAPELVRFQKQSTNNRQGSGESFSADEAAPMRDRFIAEQIALYQNYDALVQRGVAKEVARLNTPVSRYSKMRAKTDLRNWLSFLQLRMAPSAQFEIRQYANAVAEMVKTIWPRTYALFEEHDLRGAHLSGAEVALLRNYFKMAARPSTEEGQALLRKLGA